MHGQQHCCTVHVLGTSEMARRTRLFVLKDGFILDEAQWLLIAAELKGYIRFKDVGVVISGDQRSIELTLPYPNAWVEGHNAPDGVDNHGLVLRTINREVALSMTQAA